MYKLSAPLDDQEQPYYHPEIYAREETTGPQRLVIAPTQHHVQWLRRLSEGWEEGFFLLYVLLHPRSGRQAGRYQSPAPLPREEVERFLMTFGHFLETDGRHHLWLGSTRSEGTLVYDQHNLIYAYGALEGYERRLREGAFHEAPVTLPSPHTHHLHATHDAQEEALFAWWSWTWYPLQPEDER
jgi:hypothetical protein